MCSSLVRCGDAKSCDCSVFHACSTCIDLRGHLSAYLKGVPAAASGVDWCEIGMYHMFKSSIECTAEEMSMLSAHDGFVKGVLCVERKPKMFE